MTVLTRELELHLQAIDLHPLDRVSLEMNTEAYNEIAAAALNSISEALTTDDLIALNNLVDVERQQPDRVAEEWLIDQGLLS